MLEHNQHILESVEGRPVVAEHQNQMEEEVEEHHHQERRVIWEPEPVDQPEAVEHSLHTSR